MNVEGMLRAKGRRVVTIAPSASIGELVAGLRDEEIGAMVVSEDGRVPLGIISERDVVRALAARGPAILGLPVAELMTHPVVACAPSDTVRQVMAVMTFRRIRHLPVLAEGVLVGLVSIGDVVKSRLEELETETNVLREAYMGRM